MTEFEFEQEKHQGVNRSVFPTHCKTCGGDRFVVYATRPAVQSLWMKERGLQASGRYDEMSPCPDCNPIEDPRLPDPAQVRERLRT